MDITALLAPLPDPSPCGTDMSFSTEFDELQVLRREDDPTLSQGEWVTEIKRADWPGVVRACSTLLATRTKDLRLAGWLAEAAARVEGFGGLADGLELYAGLCRDFWDGAHPLPDGSDHELRIGSITWLLAQVIALSRSLPVLRHGAGAYSLTEIASVRLRARSSAEDEGAAATLDTLERALRVVPPAQWLQMLSDLRRVPPALAALQAVVDQHLGADGPGFVAAREAAQEALAAVERLARDAGAVAGAQPAAATGSTEPSGSGTVSSTQSNSFGGAPQSRTQALAQLRMVADYFRRNEPHSPVAYLADRAARWGEMPLHLWLRAVLKEQGSIAALDELLGVEPPADER